MLAENKRDRGKFIVLDGKQRLLAILQFWGLGTGENNSYPLSALTLREDLKGISFNDLSQDPAYEEDYNELCNQPIRTVVIRNWKDTNFLHTVFLRLNTGSVNLSPQELRQALLPGEFSNYVDDCAGQSPGLRRLLGIEGPDPRMRDTEILARFLSFRFFANTYPGRMKKFLDDTFEEFNTHWLEYKPKIEAAVADFEKGINELLEIFSEDVARKPGSRQFNRAVFDALIFFHSQERVRNALSSKSTDLKQAYQDLFSTDSGFLKAVESDTAGAPNTKARLSIWAETISRIAQHTFNPPDVPITSSERQNSRKQVSGTTTRR